MVGEIGVVGRVPAGGRDERCQRGAGSCYDRGMVTAGLVVCGIAAVLHVYIFVLESVTWTSSATRAVFGTTAEEAEATRQLAFNQGFYNLFLAISVAVGIVLVAAGERPAGSAAVFVGAGSMVAAGVVLLLSDRSKAAAAFKQLTLPLIGVVVLAIGLAR